MSRGRLVAAALVVGGVVYALTRGEFSTLDWWTLKRQVAEERTAIDELKVAIDSLGAYADSLEHDPATQERVAREKFGMLRDGEVLYKVTPLEP